MSTQQEVDVDVASAESKLPLMFRLKGTVILKIWWQIIFVIIYTAIVVCIHNFVEGMQMKFPMTLVPVLGVVTGLLLVFRTNTAYDRYWEGRRLWSQMTLNIRTLTRCIWVGVEEKSGTAQDIVEKTSAINLLIAFAYATKNYLREEYSYDEEDMKDLISHLPRFSTPSSNQPLEMQDPFSSNISRKSIDLGKKQSSLSASNNTSLIMPNSNGGVVKPKQYNLTAYESSTPTNIPIELSYYLTSYINDVRVRNLCDSSTISLMNGALSSLVDCLTGFERILRTPIPLAYSVHLHHSMWLYLLALPYQLVGTLNWFAIPAVALASFALLGILGIGWEIENPFGYDDNDLPLDDFCQVVRREIQMIMGRSLPTPEVWMMSRENHPFAPTCMLSAEELSKKSVAEIRSLLARNAVDGQSQGHSPFHAQRNNKDDPASLRVVTSSTAGGLKHRNETDPQELASMLKKDGTSA